jgi:hypothetical protein
MKRTKNGQIQKTPNKVQVETPIAPKHNSLALAFVLAGLSVFSCILMYPKEDLLILPRMLDFIIYLFAGLLSLSIFFAAYKKHAKFLKFAFLTILFAILLIAIAEQMILNQKDQILYFALSKFLKTLTGPFVIIGILTLSFHKEKINSIFSPKHLAHESEKPSYLKNIFSRNEIVFTSLFILIIGIGSYNLFYRLDYFDLFSDEAQVTQGAAGYLKTGEFHQYNFATDQVDTTKFYNRAKPHQFVLAQSYKIFGISPWSSRLPSALFGILMLVISYFVARYFIKDKTAALLIVFSFAFFYEFLALQRWTRMYALLFPMFLLSFYFAYKLLCESKVPRFLNKSVFINKYLDYHYPALILFALFFYISYNLHENALILLPVLFIFSVILFIRYRKIKHLIVIASGVLIILIQFIFPFDIPYRWISLFKIDHYQLYSQLFLYFPFTLEANMILLLMGVGLVFMVKNESLFKKLLLLFLSTLTGLIMFSYVVDFNVAFRYMSFLAPITIMAVIGILFIFTSLYKKIVSISVVALLIVSVLLQFAFKYDDLYVKNPLSPTKTTVAWKIINENYKPGEVLFMHWGPTLYLDSINPDVKILELHSFRDDRFVDVLDSIYAYKAGWVTWKTHNGDYIHKKLREYARLYMKKYHGYGIDNTGVEVYYYTDSMLRPYDQYTLERTSPVANLNSENPFSFAFFLKIDENTSGNIFTFSSDSIMIQTYLNSNQQLIHRYSNSKSDSLMCEIPLERKNHVVIYHSGGKKGNKFGVYLNGEPMNESQLSENVQYLLKFKVNVFFKGFIDDLRYYNFVLSDDQIKEIIKTDARFGSATLNSNGKEYTTLFHWQK